MASTKNKLTDQQVTVYKCTSCERTFQRDDLTVKKSIFQKFGKNGKWLRSRVVAWLCDDCRNDDQDWTREDNKGGRPHAPTEDN